MYLINRKVAVIKPTAVFLEWLRNLPDWDLDMTLEDLRNDCTAILIPEPIGRTPEYYIEGMYREIFEIELDSWERDQSKWSQQMNLETFREWFDIEIHSIVLEPNKRKIKWEKYTMTDISDSC